MCYHSPSQLGHVAYLQGDYARATARAEESLTLFRELGDKGGIAYALCNLGSVASGQGDRRARALYAESLALSQELEHRVLAACSLEGLAAVAGALGQPEQAARLGRVAEAQREAIGVPLMPVDVVANERTVQAAGAALGADAFEAAWAAGQALTLEQAVAEALQNAGSVGLAEGGRLIPPGTTGNAGPAPPDRAP